MILRLTAHNSAMESENRIHADDIARQYGFRGGLVPGVTVYGYLMQTVPEWIGSAQVRLLKPVFEADEIEIIRDGNCVTALRDTDLCAELTIGDFQHPIQPIADAPLPADRPPATRATLIPGTTLGTLRRQFTGPDPETLLGLANYALIDNFVLSPWLHASSNITYHQAARAGEELLVHSRIHDRFDKKGREFVVLDVMLSQASRPLQSIRHTAIYCLG